MRLNWLFAFTALSFLLWFGYVDARIHKTEQEVTSSEEENESEESSDEETERVTKVTPKDDAEVSSYLAWFFNLVDFRKFFSIKFAKIIF